MIKLASNFGDFCTFSTLLLETGDIDPAYPVLRRALADLSRDHALWYTAAYVAYYNLGSVERFARRHAVVEPIEAHEREIDTCAIERRGFRGSARGPVALLNDFEREMREAGGAEGWIEKTFAPFGEHGWHRGRAALEVSISGVGSWASYKWADLLRNVHGVMITAPDLGVGGGGEYSGPIPGMVKLLTRTTWQQCASDSGLARKMLWRMQERGVPIKALEELETCLCKWNSLTKGRYYVGHDIHALSAEVERSGLMRLVMRDVFSPHLLADAVDEHRLTDYRDRRSLGRMVPATPLAAVEYEPGLPL